MIQSQLLANSGTPLLAVGILKPKLLRQSPPDHAQLLRRIDWRFLLPDPALHHVAYIGGNDGTLLSALQTFSESLTTIPVPQRSDSLSRARSFFDLVVLRSTNPQDVALASKILTSDAYLYWEYDRRSALPADDPNIRGWWSEAKRWVMRPLRVNLSHTKKFVDTLNLSGFCDIEVHWHRPNFDDCLEIIPLHGGLAIKYVFSRNKRTLKGQMESFAGGSLSQIGLLPRLIPCFSLVARKSSQANKAA